MANFCGVSGGWKVTEKSCIWSIYGNVLALAEAADMCNGLAFQLLLLEQTQGVWQATTLTNTFIKEQMFSW